MIKLSPYKQPIVECGGATEALAALKEIDKACNAVIVLCTTDGDMLEFNTLVNETAQTKVATAGRFGGVAEFWAVGNVFPIDENQWKITVGRQARNPQAEAQAQQVAMRAMGPLNGGRR